MNPAKPLVRQPSFWIAVAAIVITLAAVAYPYAYRQYGAYLISKGVSTDYRPGQPCTPDSKDPCIMPDGTEVRP